MKAGLATSLSIAGVLATGGAALVLNSSILDTESSAKGSPAFATVVGLESAGGVTPLGDGTSGGAVAGLSADGVAGAINGQQTPLADPVVVQADGTLSTAEATSGVPAATSTPGTIGSGSTYRGSGNIRQTQTNLSTTDSTLAPSPSSSTPEPTPSTNPAAVEKQFKVGDAATITLIVSGAKLTVKDVAITPGSGYRLTNQTSRDGDDVRITLTSATNAIEFSARLVNGQVMAAVSTPSSGNLTPPRPPHRDDDDDDDDHEDRDHEREEEHEREHEDDDD